MNLECWWINQHLNVRRTLMVRSTESITDITDVAEIVRDEEVLMSLLISGRGWEVKTVRD